jgi:hypothetical protein
MRYQLAVLTELWPEVFSGYVKSAKKLEQLLGEDHNLAVLTDVLNQSPGKQKAFKLIASSVEKKQSKLRAKAKLLAGCLYAESPKVWDTRLYASWRAWQTKS